MTHEEFADDARVRMERVTAGGDVLAAGRDIHYFAGLSQLRPHLIGRQGDPASTTVPAGEGHRKDR